MQLFLRGNKTQFFLNTLYIVYLKGFRTAGITSDTFLEIEELIHGDSISRSKTIRHPSACGHPEDVRVMGFAPWHKRKDDSLITNIKGMLICYMDNPGDDGKWGKDRFYLHTWREVSTLARVSSRIRDSTSKKKCWPLTYRVFIKYCGFLKILIYLPDSVFSRCQCVYTRQAGRTPALQQNWQSSENSKNLRKNTIFNEHPVAAAQTS